jgi:pimeloyl-ACP methyl ester carboxylesterase
MPAPAEFPINKARLSEVDVPVLLVFPEKDPIFAREGQEQQRGNYCLEPAPLTNCDVQVQWLAGTGHFPMLERTAPQFRALVADWLCSRGLVSATNGRDNGPCG